MKSDYLNDQYLLETEQEQDFWKKMQDQLLFINEIPAIGNFDAYEKLAQHGYLDTEGCLRPNHKGENTEGAGKCHAPSSG